MTRRTGVRTRRMHAGWASVPSDAHRARNEDAWFALPERGFFGVFDGMGGYADGDLAARIAAEEVLEVLLPLAPNAEPEAVADTLRDALFSADRALQTLAGSGGGTRGMGTTAVVAAVRPSEEDGVWSALVAWAGDSRALRLPAGWRALEALTLDDGVVRLHALSVAHARKVQATLGAVTDARRLTLRERDYFLERNVLLQVVGTSLRHVHIAQHAVASGDRLLFVTDGVHDNLTDEEMAVVLRRESSPRTAASGLVKAARARSRDASHVRAKPDDMTALVLRFE